MLDIPCIIFAGGKSSRMGEDKSLLPFANFPTLTQFQLNKLQKIFTNVYISCKSKNKFSFDASFIEDISSDDIYAPTTGFLAIYKKLQCERFFVISVDTPFISELEIKKIIDNDSPSYDATVAILSSKTQPMIGIYHASLQSSFKKMLESNNHKLGFLLQNSHTHYVAFTQEKAFINLNHPHEYKKALTLI